MGGSEQAGSRAVLGGGHEALLPALLFLPWLSGPRASPTAPDLFFLVLAFLMASYDVADRRIPNPLTAVAAAWGLLSSWILGGPDGIVGSLAGGLVGCGLFAGFFFLGALGAGDVKALGALGREGFWPFCFFWPPGGGKGRG
jgi:prepilin peptidase CpaA